MHWLDISDMSWRVALVLRVLVGFGIAQILIKYVSHLPRRTERFLWQFAFTFAIAIALALWQGVASSNWPLSVTVFGISMVSCYGTFYSWKAIAISQSRNALFTFWDDIIAMGLAFFILHEGRFITPPIALGIGMSFAALFLFVHHEWRKGGSAHTMPGRFYLYIGIYSVTWGFGYFSQRLSAYHDLPITEFLLAWYAGAFVTAVLVYRFHPDQDGARGHAARISARGFVTIAALSATIFASMALTIVAYQAPQVVIQPVFFVSEMILPALIGLFMFHEHKQLFDEKGNLDRLKIAYFCLGGAGSLIVGLNFH